MFASRTMSDATIEDESNLHTGCTSIWILQHNLGPVNTSLHIDGWKRLHSAAYMPRMFAKQAHFGIVHSVGRFCDGVPQSETKIDRVMPVTKKSRLVLLTMWPCQTTRSNCWLQQSSMFMSKPLILYDSLENEARCYPNIALGQHMWRCLATSCLYPCGIKYPCCRRCIAVSVPASTGWVGYTAGVHATDIDCVRTALMSRLMIAIRRLGIVCIVASPHPAQVAIKRPARLGPLEHFDLVSMRLAFATRSWDR
ncbi:hypothetical protein BU25DRAFT_83095 [Macroventuria anomochaeta]|uniref:Uncharacterized protein n=1 Tax=Macroventuria anomochaeta TaxID=301207 RepID=A0ACB6SFQ8_9PLEO|nr:uncharacterized protein BU25DRAFT_83095 [Macroventuria anomochaeta]KAF2632803.1 hypothetical protein BU25DRAFT_83095 [Macroventuria anomochaeta]